YAELQQLAEDIAGIDTPALLVWGPKDPVFVEHFLRDLRHRMPQADVHRVEKASHLVSEDADVAGVVLRWLRQHFPRTSRPEAALPHAARAAESGPAAPPAPDADLAPMIFEALDARHDD